MSSSTTPNSKMSKPVPTTAISTGARKVKVTPGSHIKSFTALLDEAKGVPSNSSPPGRSNTERNTEVVANSGNSALATSGDRAAVAKVVNQSAGGTAARGAAPIAKPAENRGNDFELFDDDLSAKTEVRVPHEQSARRTNALSSSGSLPTAKSKMFRKSIVPNAPEDVFKSVKKIVPADEKKKPIVADFEQCLSLQRMKDDAGSTLLERRKALYKVYQDLAAARRILETQEVKDSLAKSMEVLRDQVLAIDQDMAKLKHFGRGFEMSKIKGIDNQAVVALVSWGVAVQFEPEQSFAVPVLAPAEQRIQDNTTLVGETTPLADTASKVVPAEPEADLSGDIDVDALLARTSKSSSTPELSPAKPSSRNLPESAAFMKRKPTCLSKPTVSIPQPLEVRVGFADTTNIIDGPTALRVEKAAKVMMKKESSAKGRPSFATTGTVKKGPFTKTADGEVRMRRKMCFDTETVGGKRKRADVYEEPNKRVATEGRSSAAMRSRRELRVSDAMEIDSALSRAGLFFTM